MLIIDSFKNKESLAKLYNYLKNKLHHDKTVVFDIHNTIEYDDGSIDDTIFSFIKKYYNSINILFLSFDGNKDRIKKNNSILNNYSAVLKKIPKIFIMERKKDNVLYFIFKTTKNRHILFVDDNEKNISDAEKLKEFYPKMKLKMIHYTAHTKKKYDIGKKYIADDLNEFVDYV